MQISETSYAVTGLGATPPWVVNSGFVVGRDRTLIVDTGMNSLAAQTIYGYALCARPQNELLVVNSEPHFDHIGGNSFFRERGARIYGHVGIRRTEEEFQATKKDYSQGIINPVRKAEQETEAFFVGTSLANPSQAIAAGDGFDLGGVEVQILGTPGHTPFNLSVYNQSDGVLFCGDCIVTDYTPNLEAGSTNDWQDWLESLRSIEALAPKVIVPGHGRILHDSAVLVEINRMKKVIATAIEQGRAPTAL